MYIKISSLSKNQDFKTILTGKKISNKYSTIFFKKLSDKNNKKLNLSIITKKKIGSAVQRNFIKRRIKNIINETIKKIKINLNYSYLLIVRRTVYDDKYENIKNKLMTDFEKIKKWK